MPPETNQGKPFDDPNALIEQEKRRLERQQRVDAERAKLLESGLDEDTATFQATANEQFRRSREFFGVPEEFNDTQAAAAIDQGFDKVVNPVSNVQDPTTVVQPPPPENADPRFQFGQGQPTLPTSGAPGSGTGVDFSQFGLGLPQTGQLGNPFGGGGPDSNEGSPTDGLNIPGINFGNIFGDIDGTTFESVSQDPSSLNPLDRLSFITGSVGGVQTDVAQFQTALSFFQDPDTGTLTAPVPQVDIGGTAVPVQALAIPRGQGIILQDGAGNRQEVFTGFEGIGAVVGIDEQGRQIVQIGPEITRQFELGKRQEDILGRLISEVGDLSSADAQRRLDVAMAVFGAEIDTFNRDRQIAQQIADRNLQRELATFNRDTQFGAQVLGTQLDLVSQAFGAQFDFGLAELNNRSAEARAALNAQLQAAIFEGEQGIRLGDFASAQAARERREQIENQQVQLQQLSTITSFLAVVGQNPQIAQQLISSPELSQMLGQFGIDTAALFGDPNSAAQGLPSVQAFTNMTPANQEALLNQLAAQTGISPQNLRAQITQSGPVGSRRLTRGTAS